MLPEIDRNTFYIICLLFGLFWVLVEGYIAYLVYKAHKIIKKHLEKKSINNTAIKTVEESE